MRIAILFVLLLSSSVAMLAQPTTDVPADTVPVSSIVTADTLPMSSIVTADTLTVRNTVPFDTVRDSGYWKRALRHGKFDINDTTVIYPRFLDFCLRSYRWYDRNFNQFDTAYVASNGSRWKFHLKYNGLVAAYHVYEDESEQSMFLNSDLASSIGFRVQFLCFGFEYVPDIDNLVRGRVLDHRKTRFSFTNSRISLDAYYIKSHGITHIHRFANYNNRRYFSLPFDGMSRSVLGIDAFYFFNYKRYAHSAAYNYSKIQRRSAGSFLLGMQYSKQEMTFDMAKLPAELREHLSDSAGFKLNYTMKDYAINVGYAYNWVPKRNWLINVMASPSVGFKRAEGTNLEDRKNHLGINFRGRLGVAHYNGKFYYGVNGSFNTYLFFTRAYILDTTILDFNIVVGFQI
ncbi:MAG: DUF4421 domain-containing protein [Muribaculaceae bacterium]|nr:DUF4421 domain-containing protein [Muribaculaceae bacterium]